MNIILDKSQFDFNYIFFKDKIKNTVYNDSSFMRIFYSKSNFIMNSISIMVQFKNLKVMYNGNKYIGHFKYCENTDIINYIKHLECYLLNIANINKQRVYSLQNQLTNEFLKIYNVVDDKNISKLYLKISGIWETNTSYGITYKFLVVDKL